MCLHIECLIFYPSHHTKYNINKGFRIRVTIISENNQKNVSMLTVTIFGYAVENAYLEKCPILHPFAVSIILFYFHTAAHYTHQTDRVWRVSAHNWICYYRMRNCKTLSVRFNMLCHQICLLTEPLSRVFHGKHMTLEPRFFMKDANSMAIQLQHQLSQWACCIRCY